MKKNTKIILSILFSLFFYETGYSQVLRKPATSRTNATSIELQEALNNALDIADPNTTPIYLIAVTRQETGEISITDWDTVKLCLSKLCDDTDVPDILSIHHTMTGTDLLKINEMKNKCKIVVFSEYFFKKLVNSGASTTIFPNLSGIEAGLVPLKMVDDCKNKYIANLAQISTNCLKTIFYPNFLCFRAFNNDPTDNAIKVIHNSVAEDSSPRTYPRLIKNVFAEIGFVVMNITLSIFKGKLLTEYKKSSYYNEANSFMKLQKIKPWFRAAVINRYAGIYDFGDGSDKIISSFTQPTSDNWTDDHTAIQNVLLKNVSTEICYDLRRKVRNSNGWSNTDNDQALLHLLQSNSIDPIGITYENDNINNLPKERLILHSDAAFNAKIGSHLFKINSTGAPVLFPKLFELTLVENKIKITVYKVIN
ncbi:MAG: hypothetical protein LBG48_00215 [Rickettsiales bacterium]|jgi:hypothetical protein|nr:hypothetical protein [Rickettsiales bacterium]